MKKNVSKNYSGIVICDSITMSVKNKRFDFRRPEAVLIAAAGFVSVILSFLNMFDLNFGASAVTMAAILFSAVYIIFSLSGKYAFRYIGASFLFFSFFAYKNSDKIIRGYKFVYNVIYKTAHLTEINYYKFLDEDMERQCITTLLVFAVWLLAMVIYTFTIIKPNPIPVIAVTFPIIEIGLYNGIDISVFWGILTVAYWLALLAMCNIDLGEYSGGSSGFVRKDNLFFPKRQMRFKVTEHCALLIIASALTAMVCTLAVMKLSGYKRSDELNQKRSEIKEAANSFTMDDLASSISTLTESFGFTINYESHKLGNTDHIKYKNTTDLIASFDKSCSDAIYLKSYAGAVYKNNEWLDLDKKAYAKANELFNDFKSYNIYPQDFPHIFMNAAYNKTDITLWLEEKKKLSSSYAPYGTANYGDMTYTNDTTVSSEKKSENSYSYKFTAVKSDSLPFLVPATERNIVLSQIKDKRWKDAIEKYCEKNNLLLSLNSFSISSCISNKNLSRDEIVSNGEVIMASLLEERYRNFVYENYLQIPDNDDIAEVENAFSDILDSADSAGSAEEKLQLLLEIRERMKSMTTYSLYPGKTPSNRDFVNYFLLENGKGYCSHYAASGVLLARMAGIPARYATGYIIVGDDFSDNNLKEDGSYSIKVADNRSHAWTEIYLDGFGWIPFEFTAGYSNNTINTETTTTESAASSVTQTTTSAVSKSTNSTSSHTSRKTSESKASAETTTTAAAAEKGGSSAPAASKTSVNYNIISVILLISAAAAIIIIRRYFILKMRRKKFSCGEASKRITAMYRYNERLLAYLKLKRNSEMYMRFADSIENTLGGIHFAEGDYRKFMEIVMLCCFSENKPDKNSIDFCYKFTTNFADSVYKSSNILKKLWLKIIRVLI